MPMTTFTTPKALQPVVNSLYYIKTLNMTHFISFRRPETKQPKPFEEKNCLSILLSLQRGRIEFQTFEHCFIAYWQ